MFHLCYLKMSFVFGTPAFNSHADERKKIIFSCALKSNEQKHVLSKTSVFIVFNVLVDVTEMSKVALTYVTFMEVYATFS